MIGEFISWISHIFIRLFDHMIVYWYMLIQFGYFLSFFLRVWTKITHKNFVCFQRKISQLILCQNQIIAWIKFQAKFVLSPSLGPTQTSGILSYTPLMQLMTNFSPKLNQTWIFITHKIIFWLPLIQKMESLT